MTQASESELDTVAQTCASILNTGCPIRECLWQDGSLYAIFQMPSNPNHSVHVEMGKVYSPGSAYLWIRATLTDGRLDPQDLKAFTAHQTMILHLVESCQKVCEKTGVAEPTE